MHHVLIAILAAGILAWAGGCDSWTRQDSFEARAAKDPNLSPELKALLDKKKQQQAHGRRPKPGDPKLVEQMQKQSQKDQEKTRKQFAEAQKKHHQQMEKQKNEKQKGTSAGTDSAGGMVPPP